MARYIDADLLKELIDGGFDIDFDELPETKKALLHMIDYQETADVVEVVRCKDCKHRKGAFHTDRRRKEGGYWIYWCELDTGDPFELGRNAEDDNWFCADGERRTDDAEIH